LFVLRETIRGALLIITSARFAKSKASKGTESLNASILMLIYILIPHYVMWPAPGSADTELGVLMEPEVSHGKAEVYAGVQA
jgi:hypothetical protein